MVIHRDGTGIAHTGEYLGLGRPRRRVFNWSATEVDGNGDNDGDVSRVIVAISPNGTGCEVTLTHELHPRWADFADQAASSWGTMLAALDADLA